MRNYYEGALEFRLKKDLPECLLGDLINFSSEKNTGEFIMIQGTKWAQHEWVYCPQYTLKTNIHKGEIYYVFYVDFCMTGYMQDGVDLGEAIYDILKPYIDKTLYDMSDGGCVGRVHDEDHTYDRTFYVDYDNYKKEIKNRKHICNKECANYTDEKLCRLYSHCQRAYLIGRQEIVDEETR